MAYVSGELHLANELLRASGNWKAKPPEVQWVPKRTFGFFASFPNDFETSIFEKFVFCSIKKWSYLSSNSKYFPRYGHLKFVNSGFLRLNGSGDWTNRENPLDLALNCPKKSLNLHVRHQIGLQIYKIEVNVKYWVIWTTFQHIHSFFSKIIIWISIFCC